MIIFLHGEDTFLVGRRKRLLMDAFRKKYSKAETFVFDFEDQGTPQDVKRALDACAGGLFAEEKLVVFLHPFVVGEGGEKLLMNFLKNEASQLPEKVVLLFVHTGKIKKTHPVTKWLLAGADKIEEEKTLQGKALENFLTKELARLNERVRFDPSGLRLFLERTKGNTALMLSELEKLAAYTGEGIIGQNEVQIFLQAPEENTIFLALDALGQGERSRALLLFRQEGERVGEVYALLSMCAWQVRRLLLVRDAYDRGIRRPADIVTATKLPPFTVQKAVATIEHFSSTRLGQGLVLLSDIDTALKQGKVDPEVSLDLFVWKF
jgi:DNA polymerase III subunit delta